MTSTEPRPKTRIRAMRMLIDKGARRYAQSRHLDRLFGARGDAAATDPAATIARLKRALRSQRQLGRSGH